MNEILFKKLYEYKDKTIIVHARGLSEKTGRSIILWTDVEGEDQTFKFTPEDEMLKEPTLKLIEKVK